MSECHSTGTTVLYMVVELSHSRASAGPSHPSFCPPCKRYDRRCCTRTSCPMPDPIHRIGPPWQRSEALLPANAAASLCNKAILPKRMVARSMLSLLGMTASFARRIPNSCITNSISIPLQAAARETLVWIRVEHLARRTVGDDQRRRSRSSQVTTIVKIVIDIHLNSIFHRGSACPAGTLPFHGRRIRK